MFWCQKHIRRQQFIGITGKEAADKAAKHALDLPITQMVIHYEDYKLHIKTILIDYGRENGTGAQEIN